MTVEIKTYGDAATLATSLADIVAGQLAQAIIANGRATLVVPGGSTPGPFLHALSQADIDWGKVAVLLSDERFVPETSDRSNARLLRETLLQGKAAQASFIPMYMAGERPEDVLAELSHGIRQALPLDVCVLGMGLDLHTASLFPGADNLDAALSPDCKEVLMAMRAEGAGEPRLTLSAPVLSAAKHIHLLITGEAKLAALEIAMQQGPVNQAPVRAILDAAIVHYA